MKKGVELLIIIIILKKWFTNFWVYFSPPAPRQWAGDSNAGWAWLRWCSDPAAAPRQTSRNTNSLLIFNWNIVKNFIFNSCEIKKNLSIDKKIVIQNLSPGPFHKQYCRSKNKKRTTNNTSWKIKLNIKKSNCLFYKSCKLRSKIDLKKKLRCTGYRTVTQCLWRQ